MILLSKAALVGIVGHCLDAEPLEACGLLTGWPDRTGCEGQARIAEFYPAENTSASARIYEVEPRALMAADRQAELAGKQLIGVYHSHTHTEAKPSPTDIAHAPDPEWHYVLVSLRDTDPSFRSWKIANGKTTEEQVVLEW